MAVEKLRAEIDALAAVSHTEQALRESEGRARPLLESASEAIVIVDGQGHIILVNARTEAMFGFPVKS